MLPEDNSESSFFFACFYYIHIKAEKYSYYVDKSFTLTFQYIHTISTESSHKNATIRHIHFVAVFVHSKYIYSI